MPLISTSLSDRHRDQCDPLCVMGVIIGSVTEISCFSYAVFSSSSVSLSTLYTIMTMVASLPQHLLHHGDHECNLAHQSLRDRLAPGLERRCTRFSTKIQSRQPSSTVRTLVTLELPGSSIISTSNSYYNTSTFSAILRTQEFTHLGPRTSTTSTSYSMASTRPRIRPASCSSAGSRTNITWTRRPLEGFSAGHHPVSPPRPPQLSSSPRRSSPPQTSPPSWGPLRWSRWPAQC